MNIDVSALKLKDATKEEKKRLFWLMNLRGFVSLLSVALCLLGVFIVPRKFNLMLWIVLGIASVIVVFCTISDMPAWKCKVCHGTVTNKREVSASKDTGLYYNAVTFTSETGEVLEAMPVYSDKTLGLLEEGTAATIVCYNKRLPVIFSDKQIFPKK